MLSAGVNLTESQVFESSTAEFIRTDYMRKRLVLSDDSF